MYGTIENIDKIRYNKGLNKIQLLGDNDTIDLESFKDSNVKVANELLRQVMQIVYELTSTTDMIDVIEKELCDNHGSYEILGD